MQLALTYTDGAVLRYVVTNNEGLTFLTKSLLVLYAARDYPDSRLLGTRIDRGVSHHVAG
jgi:hypothetical protein